MPIYEYACDKCGHEFEELVFEKDERPACPKCGATDTRKLMSACARCASRDTGGDFSMPPASTGGGCTGCSGGNCASCGR